MSRLRCRTMLMWVATGPVVVPNSAACRARYATFALHAVDVRTRAADPSALHDRRSPTGSCQVPGEELPALSTTEYERVIPFRCSHMFLLRKKKGFRASAF